MVRGFSVTACPVLAGILAAWGLAACTVGPDYVRPGAPIPEAYKWQSGPSEGGKGQEGGRGEKAGKREAGWRKARPADAADRGAWWASFNDPVLDGLLRQVDVSNQNVAAAEAAVRSAAFAVAASRSALFPTVDLNASGQRARTAVTGGGGGSGRIGNAFRATETASWVPDLWGRLRASVTNEAATAQASAGDLAAARLAAQSQLATAHMQIRVADELRRLLDASA